MIDNAALLVFGLLIVYTVYRAITLDKRIPWFSRHEENQQPSPPDKKRR
jgi:uncharacterized paraquat-inducible protein A